MDAGFVCTGCGSASVEINRARPSVDDRYPLGHCVGCTPWPKPVEHPLRPGEKTQPPRNTIPLIRADLFRHRLFETGRWKIDPAAYKWHPPCRGMAERAARRRGWEYRDMSVTGKGRRAGTADRWAELLGIDRAMRQHDLKEAIPPAYTDYVGRELSRAIRRGSVTEGSMTDSAAVAVG